MVMTSSFDQDDGAWRDGAACRDRDPGMFFPLGSTGAALDDIRAAKAVCQTCEVRRECLQFAVATNQQAGVWGGMSEEERRRLRRSPTATARVALLHR